MAEVNWFGPCFLSWLKLNFFELRRTSCSLQPVSRRASDCLRIRCRGALIRNDEFFGTRLRTSGTHFLRERFPEHLPRSSTALRHRRRHAKVRATHSLTALHCSSQVRVSSSCRGVLCFLCTTLLGMSPEKMRTRVQGDEASLGSARQLIRRSVFSGA